MFYKFHTKSTKNEPNNSSCSALVNYLEKGLYRRKIIEKKTQKILEALNAAPIQVKNQAFATEIDQESNFQSVRFQVVESLSKVYILKFNNCLQFYKNFSFDYKVSSSCSNWLLQFFVVYILLNFPCKSKPCNPLICDSDNWQLNKKLTTLAFLRLHFHPGSYRDPAMRLDDIVNCLNHRLARIKGFHGFK